MQGSRRTEQPLEKPSSGITLHLGTCPRVLLAEDDDELRELVAIALRAEGYDVTTVADGGRLLVKIAGTYLASQVPTSYDLLVSDLRMPVCNGLEILEQLRHARRKMPAILMSAQVDPTIRARAAALGARLFIKPFPVKSLLSAARALLAEPPAA